MNEHEMLKARTACREEDLSLLGKAASHCPRSYGEEEADDRRSASNGEKEGFQIVCSCNICNKFNCGT